MEKVIEEKFVNTYICKRVQNRILSGLFCEEKRKSLRLGLSKLMDYINVDFVYLRSMHLDINETENELRKLAYDLKLCYVIAGPFDGIIMPFKQALNECFNDSLASIIIVNDNLAFVKTEVRNGQSMKYILHNRRRY